MCVTVTSNSKWHTPGGPTRRKLRGEPQTKTSRPWNVPSCNASAHKHGRGSFTTTTLLSSSFVQRHGVTSVSDSIRLLANFENFINFALMKYSRCIKSKDLYDPDNRKLLIERVWGEGGNRMGFVSQFAQLLMHNILMYTQIHES